MPANSSGFVCDIFYRLVDPAPDSATAATRATDSSCSRCSASVESPNRTALSKYTGVMLRY